MVRLHIDESLVLFVDNTDDYRVVERVMAGTLQKGGFTKEGYAQAVLTRESQYPTALEVGEFNVAIPHCDAKHTISDAACVAILPQGIAWPRMDDPDEECMVRMAIMLAFTNPHDQIELLQKVIAFIQNQTLVEQLVSGMSAAEIARIVDTALS